MVSTQGLREGGGDNEGQQPDLVVKGTCTVKMAGKYYYGNVNIFSPGSLTFIEPIKQNSLVEFWASSIIVESGGSLVAGSEKAPYGSRGGELAIYIYGANQSVDANNNPVDPTTKPGQGVLCKTAETKKEKQNGKDVDVVVSGPCGIPLDRWTNNGEKDDYVMPGKGGIKDAFYQYGPLYGDDLCSDGKTRWNSSTLCGTSNVGYFGYKVLAVSYDGTLQLFGYKGTPLPKAPRQLFGALHRFFGKQGTGGAPATFEASSANPETDTKQSFGDFFRQWVQSHNGGGGRGSGGGGNSHGSSDLPACAKPDPDSNPLSTGCSWLRLAGDLAPDADTLTLSAAAGDKWWDSSEKGDKIVVTTTDYLPGHYEELTIDKIEGNTITFHPKIKWPHKGTQFLLASRMPDKVQKRLTDAGMDSNLIATGAETRAGVALMTRSIRILSGGDKAGETFDQASAISANCKEYAPGKKPVVPYCYSFGAHMVFRQGFKQVQVQGVEFGDMGQAGKLGHYPVHFHMARRVPTDTFIKDSSINESMTRWIVLHSTQGVLVQRNVGYKSIGHGFYLESGPETDNKFYSNLGIFARAAIDNPQNPRKIPGILAADMQGLNDKNQAINLPNEAFPYRSDYDHPAVFWMSNGWNDFIGNMAAGAGACGTAYWLLPDWNSDMMDVPTAKNQGPGKHMKWTGFAGLQWTFSFAASTPLKSFYGNYATSTMNSFFVIGSSTNCHGLVAPSDPLATAPNHVAGIKSFAPLPRVDTNENVDKDMYYPHMVGSGRQATKCPAIDVTKDQYDCSQFTSGRLPICNNGASLAYCAVIVIDHFTSSFHWAETNFAAIWLRPQWYLYTNSVLTDVQNGGITALTSGTYDRSAVIEGDWALARTSVFVGNTQTGNGFASNAGPFSNGLPNALTCEGNVGSPKQYCLSITEGISLPLTNFGTNQRLFSIYDGPMYEDSNAYIDITKSPCDNCMYANTLGYRKETIKGKDSCYLPNAAVAWKQPNGFFYPPSFHSSNLFFANVDIRHYVIDALFKENTYLQNTDRLTAEYCKPVSDVSYATDFFQGFTDIDRQTELNDDDGSLTGLANDAGTGTISVNPIEFFNAPVETAECLSNLGITPNLACPDTAGKLPVTPTAATAKTSPYDYVTTVVFPQCGLDSGGGPNPGRCGDMTKDDFVPPDRTISSVGREGEWSRECSNPACYGVPLYRQFLTGTGTSSADATREAKRWFDNDCNLDQTSEKCRWPFARMGGQSTYQRSTMTVNLGTYYLDTTVKKDTQRKEPFTTIVPCDLKPTGACQPRSVNEFQKGQTYYMFFLYAKRATKQTYQIYVGPGFNMDTDLKAMRANLNSLPVSRVDPADWPAAWEKHYNDAVACKNSKPFSLTCGILQVTIDMKDQADLDLKPKNGLCLPHTFCKSADGDTGDGPCGCALTDNDPLVKASPVITVDGQKTTSIQQECQRTCKVWAVKDLDFPTTGPLGFSFKMPNDPDGQGLAHRPVPEFFPATADTSKPDWLAKFVKTPTVPDNATGGACYYPQMPSLTVTDPKTECSMPTNTPVP